MMIYVNAYHHVSLKILKFALYSVITSIMPMLIPDLLNTLFDQSNYDNLIILRSLNKHKTNYANKYSLLRHYGFIAEYGRKPDRFIKSICKLGPIKIIKHIISHVDNRDESLHWSEETGPSKYMVEVHEIYDDNGICVLYNHHSCNYNCTFHYSAKDCALHYSAGNDDIHAVKYLMSVGANIHSGDGNALLFSAENGNIHVVKYLISLGADVNAYDDYALQWSAENGHINVVKYLVDMGANVCADNSLALQNGTRKGHIHIVKYLMERGAHYDHDDLLLLGAHYGHLSVVKYFVELGADVHTDHDAALRWSANNGHLEVVKYLVNVGADAHANCNEALQWSAKNGHLKVVKYLVNVVGANIHVNDGQLFSIKMIRDNFGHYLNFYSR